MPTDPHPAAGRTVAVLGGTGFLGRHVTAAFAAAGARVHAVSRSGGSGTVPGRDTVRLDLLSAAPAEIAGVLAATGAEVVVNAAGRVWLPGERQMAEGNAELVERLVEALALLPGPPVRLVQIGTVHEYGAGMPGAATTEEHVPAPVTAYGRTKLQGTQAVVRAVSERGIDGVVLRHANAIGAGVPLGSLFGRIVAHLGAVACGEAPAVLRVPPLRAARDLVDVGDAAAAVLAAATAPKAAVTGRVINIGRGEAVPVRRLVHRMVELSGLAVAIVEEPGPEPARADVAWQRLDITRAEQLLGWRPRRSLDDSLRDLLAPVLPPGQPRPSDVTTTSDTEQESS